MSEILFNSPQPSQSPLQSQIENFQTTLASLNQQLIILQEALQERDQQIADLKMELAQNGEGSQEAEKVDDTLTIVGVFIKLYRLVFPPGKDNAVPLAG